MIESTFRVAKMDCAAEEQLVRLSLEDLPPVASLQIDIPHRTVKVYHSGDSAPLLDTLDRLRLDTSLLESVEVGDGPSETPRMERRVLWWVLGINFGFFVLEMATGILSNSMGLVADSLDMLADSLVYGLALAAVGGTLARKKAVARSSGYFQLALAVLGLAEVVRRFLGYGEVPTFSVMIGVAALALLANVASLYLLQMSESQEVHIQASMIFTSNDIIINLGVILAGVLVYLTSSKVPDLVVGAVVFIIVARGAYRILQISK